MAQLVSINLLKIKIDTVAKDITMIAFIKSKPNLYMLGNKINKNSDNKTNVLLLLANNMFIVLAIVEVF